MKTFDKELVKSRFFTLKDEKKDFLLYKIPEQWWSRLYEYVWAGHFAESNDICLDAACGVGHHLKYYLAYNCSKVYACDIDPAILNKQGMINIIKNYYGDQPSTVVAAAYDKIDFRVADLSNLPYENEKFDKIYCISVLEHLSYDTMEKSFREFHRTLKDNGLLILTFDYPSINPGTLRNCIERTNFKFLGDVDFGIPNNVLDSYIYPGLKCIRTVLRKA